MYIQILFCNTWGMLILNVQIDLKKVFIRNKNWVYKGRKFRKKNRL